MDWSKSTLRDSGIRPLVALLPLPFLLAMTACEVTEEEHEAIDSSFAIESGSGGSELPLPQAGPGCFVERHRQPEASVTRKIDILFVVDTSASLDEERALIGEGVDAFVEALPSEADYQIGVMLAHGPRGSEKGRLWKYRNEPHVLSSGELSLEQIRSHLRSKMANVRRDNHSDGGEMGLYSLNLSMREGKLDSMRAHGFYREDAALAVIFVADENDICADYPESVNPVPDPQGIEDAVKARDCDGITPENVLANLRALQGDRPLFVGGVLYTDRNTYSKTGENEIGYGYLETVRVANGKVIDLAQPHYHEGLGELGLLASVQLQLDLEFALENSGIEPGSIQAFVDGEPVPHLFVPETNEVHLTAEAGGSRSYVDFTYCPKAQEPTLISEVCAAGQFEPQAVVNLGVSMDPDSGLTNLFNTGFGAMGITPTYYSDAEIISGKPIDDGTTVLFIARKVVLQPVDQEYIDGVAAFIENGGSVVGEYDGAGMMFTEFSGTHSTVINMDPSFRLFSGLIEGGGVLLPLESSTTFVTDPYHPIMEGIPSEFLFGLRTAYALTGYNGEWLHQSAIFTSTGHLDQVPAGTYPSVLSGRCGSGRVALFLMNYMNSVNQTPVRRMLENAIRWSVGQQ